MRSHPGRIPIPSSRGAHEDDRNESTNSFPLEQTGVRCIEQRRIVDVIVQTAGVDLFRDYGIAVAPILAGDATSCPPAPGALGSRVQFQGKAVRGTLTIWLGLATLRRAIPAGTTCLNEHDWMRELCNQLMGRIKSRCMRYQLALQSGVPSLIDTVSYGRMTSGQPERGYLFRALSGPAIVWLGGDLERAPFSFSGAVEVVSEGDMVIF